MQKTNQKLWNLIILALLVFVMTIGMPSTAFAKSVLTITATKDGNGIKYSGSSSGGSHVSLGKKSGVSKGTEGDPIYLNVKYDEIVINYEKNPVLPFYFRLEADGGNFIGKYMINVDYNKGQVLFTRLGASGNASEFLVTPPSRNMGSSYLQAGGQYFDGFTDMGFTYPTYKITVQEKGGNITRDYTLGNGFLSPAGPINNAYASSTTSHPAIFVFCASGKSGSSIYSYSSGQSGASFALQEEGTLTKKKISDFKSRVNSKNFDITYEFYGSSSEILDNSESGWVEQLIAKVLIGFGDALWSLTQSAFGKEVGIDALIFNEYEPTIVDYFGDGGARGQYYDIMQTVVNGWYSAFRTWALVILSMILVAMGVKAILISGTGKQRKISGMFVGWLTAIMLMFFGPYFMKYMIQINDVIVKTLRDNSKYSMYSIYNFDFITRLGLTSEQQYHSDYAYQTGEDSEANFIKYLYGLQDEIAGMSEAEENELKEYREKYTNLKKELNNIGKTDGVSIKIQTYRSSNKTISNAMAQSMSDIGKGKTPQEAVDRACKKVFIKDPDTNELIESPELTSRVRSLLLDYLTSYERYKALKEAGDQINNYLKLADKNIDLMGTMMDRANEAKRIVYVVIWFILLYQLIMLVVLYYKRLLTIAVLIILFPLVVMFYGLEKLMGIDKSQALKTWITEYLVNVFIQSVHALLYLMLIETGLTIFEQDSDNWLLYLFSVTALFPMESIVRSIIGMRSSTVSELKNSAKQGLAYGAAAGAFLRMGKDIKDIRKETDKEYDRKEAQKEEKYEKEDQKRDLKQTKAQNKIHQDAARGADVTRRQEHFDAQKEKSERKTASKRERDRKIMNARRTAAKINRTAKAVAAPVNALAMGIAAGGAGEDFVKAGAVVGTLAGTNRKVSALNKKEAENAEKYNNRYAADGSYGQSGGGAANAQQNGNAAANNRNMAAENAKKATEDIENGTQTTSANGGDTNHVPTQREANEMAKHAALQNAYRERIASDIANIKTRQQLGFTTDDETNM